jgi:hypothetical protein
MPPVTNPRLPNETDPAATPAFIADSPVHQARFVGKGDQLEMHVALRTAALGNLEVHTTIHADRVGVIFASEKADLGNALAANLPSLENGVRQHDLRLDTVQFVLHTPMSGSGFSSTPQHDNRPFHQPVYGPQSVIPETGNNVAPEEAVDLPRAHGLSIHA